MTLPSHISRETLHVSDAVLLGVNYWSRAGGPFMWRDYDDDVVRDELDTLRKHGVALTRSFLFWPDFHPEPDVVDEAMMDAYATFLATSAELGVLTIPTFLVGHMSGEDWDVPWRAGRDLYTDPFMLDRQAWFIGRVVERFAGSGAVWGWLVSNEFTNYAGTSTPDAVRGWAQVCAAAIRDAGGTQPMSLGDGAWTMELTGRDNGFRIRQQLDLVDFIGPHSYPMDTDQLRVHASASFSCELAHFGKPVVLEEFGVSDALSSDDAASALYRQSFHLSLLAGATGWIPWNNTDFDLWDQDPYRHHPFELGFGLTRADGSPKPQLEEVRQFRRVLDEVDFPRTHRRPTDTAIVLSSFIDQHPRVTPDERPPIAHVTKHAYLAARAAGLAPAVVRELELGERPAFVVVPSNKLITAPTVRRLEEWARAGSTVYYSWFSGVSGSHRGSWWPDVAAMVGLPHRLRYGMREPVDDVVTWTVEVPFGGLPAGATLRFPLAGSAEARHMLPLDDSSPAPGVEVVARDQRGRPALVRRRVGGGAVWTSTYSIEYFGSARPDAHVDDEVHRLYEALAAEAGAVPEIRSGDARVFVDGLVHDDGREFVWFVNVSGDPVAVRPQVPGGVALLALPDDGGTVVGEIGLEPYDVRVVERRTIS